MNSDSAQSHLISKFLTVASLFAALSFSSYSAQASNSCVDLFLPPQKISFREESSDLFQTVEKKRELFGDISIIQRRYNSGWSDNRKEGPDHKLEALQGDLVFDLRSMRGAVGEVAGDYWGFKYFDKNKKPIKTEDIEQLEYLGLPGVEYLNQATDYFNSHLAKTPQERILIRYYWTKEAFASTDEYLWRFAFKGEIPIAQRYRQRFHDLSAHSLEGVFADNRMIERLQLRVKMAFDARGAWEELVQTFSYARGGKINVDELWNSPKPLLQFLHEKGLPIAPFRLKHGQELSPSRIFSTVSFREYYETLTIEQIKNVLTIPEEQFNSWVKRSELTEPAFNELGTAVDLFGDLLMYFSDIETMYSLDSVGKQLNKNFQASEHWDADFLEFRRPYSTHIRNLQITNLRTLHAGYQSEILNITTDKVLKRAFPEAFEKHTLQKHRELLEEYGRIATAYRELGEIISGNLSDEVRNKAKEFRHLLETSEVAASSRMRLLRIKEAYSK